MAETLDCAEAQDSLGLRSLDKSGIEETIGCITKSMEDGERLRAAMATVIAQIR